MLSQKRYSIAVAWGLLHGINDWIAGFILTAYSLQQPITNSSAAFLLYAILGFGGQLPAGIWLDRSRSLNPFIHLSLVLLLITVPCFWLNAWSGIIIAGFSSAFLHVTGGSICLKTGEDKAGPLGVFTAPGVLGLVVGIAAGSLPVYWLALAPVGIVLLLLSFRVRLSLKPAMLASPSIRQPVHQLIEGHDWIMLLILLTVTLRSLLYDLIGLFAQNWQHGLLTVGIAAFTGKIIGGFMADRLGWKRWVYITLPLAFILLQFGRDNILALGFGIACLQSSVPISLLLMRRNMPAFPASATAMTLGTGIAIAGLCPFIIAYKKIEAGWFSHWGLATGLLLLTGIIFFLLKKRALKLSMDKNA